MNKWMKWIAAAIAAVAVLGLGVLAAGTILAERKMARKIAVSVSPVVLRSDAAYLEQGRYLFSSRGCADCHGADGAGKEVINGGPMLIISPNITKGSNSATRAYGTTDWLRTLRHGVKPDGTPVMIMPSEDYNRLTDDDVGSVISYVQHLAPVAGQKAVIQLPWIVKMQYALGIVKDAAEKIDHSLPPSVPIAVGVTVAHGAYVANNCISCHGPGLSGGRIPGAPPDWPAAANLTPGSGSIMTRYAAPEVFMAMLRSGMREDGSAVSPVMPFGALREMNDVDIKALHLYLTSLPPRDAGGH
jgi:mono/diheme cytochrome c family protein